MAGIIVGIVAYAVITVSVVMWLIVRNTFYYY